MKQLRKIISVFLLTSLLTGMFAVCSAAMYKTRTGCNVRSGPGTNYGKVGHLSSEKKVSGTMVKGHGGTMWLKITNRRFNKKTGYVSSYCLKSSSSKGVKIKIRHTCYVRKGPGSSYSITGKRARKGQVYISKSYNNGWIKISGGWIYSGYAKRI